MYDFPWTAAANDALWAAIAARLAEAGVEAPNTLTRGGDLDAQWRDPGLVFGQTCGYPYVTALEGRCRPDRGAASMRFPGCDRLRIEASSSAARATRAARWPNFAARQPGSTRWDSNTGMNLFRAAIAPIAGGAPFFRAIVVTGSHEASVAAVAEGRADLAAIDCVSFALLARGRPELIERVAVVAESPLSPCLPFIASARLGLARSPRCARRCSPRSPTRTSPKRVAALGLMGARAGESRATTIRSPRSSAARRRRDTPRLAVNASRRVAAAIHSRLEWASSAVGRRMDCAFSGA